MWQPRLKVKPESATAAAGQNYSGKYDDPNDFVVKKIAQTVVHNITISLHENNPFRYILRVSTEM